MTNEEIFEAVEEEKLKKAAINDKWNSLVCPVCGGKHFKMGNTYNLLNVKNIMDSVKGRFLREKEYSVTPYECQDCGYVLLRKVK